MRIAFLAAALCGAFAFASPASAELTCNDVADEILRHTKLMDEQRKSLRQAGVHYKDAQKHGRRAQNEFADKALVEMRYKHLHGTHLGIAGWVGKAQRLGCEPARLFREFGQENAKAAVHSRDLAEAALKN